MLKPVPPLFSITKKNLPIGDNIVNTSSAFSTPFSSRRGAFQPHPTLFPTPTPPDSVVYGVSQVCHYNPMTLDGGMGVNGTESIVNGKSVKHGPKTVFGTKCVNYFCCLLYPHTFNCSESCTPSPTLNISLLLLLPPFQLILKFLNHTFTLNI